MLAERKILKNDLNAAHEKLDDLKQTLRLEISKSASQKEDLETAKQRYETLIAALYSSTSWHITSPVRWLRLSIDRLHWQHWQRYGRCVLQKCSFFIMRRPKIMCLCRVFFARFPKIKDYLHRLIIGRPLSTKSSIGLDEMPDHKHHLALSALNYRAKSIYQDLLQSSEHKGEF